MPERVINGARLHYVESGGGTEAVVFSHGLLMSAAMFDGQIRSLEQRYRCLAYDHRGQGQSEVTASGYDMDSLTEDAATLIRELGVGPCHFVGLSMGGFVGLRLAIRHPELLRSLILLDTSADPEPPQNITPYRRMAFVGRWLGFRPIIGRVMPLMFGRTFLTDPNRAADRERWRAHLLNLSRVGAVRAARRVIDRHGVYDQLPQINVPTLVIVGEEDVSTVPATAARIHQAITGSQLVQISGAGHSSSIEQPEAVTDAITRFLDLHAG